MIDIRKKSKAQEKRTAKAYGGRTQAASGALSGAKGDVRSSLFLIENKFTDKSFYSLKFTIWDKIRKEALRDGLRTPLMQIDIQDKSYILADYYYLKELVGENYVASKFGTYDKSYNLSKDHLEFILGEDNILYYIKFCKENTELAIIRERDFQLLIDK